MGRYEALRDALRSGSFTTLHLDATQLVKHAFGLVTQARALRKQPILVYLYAEPPGWPDGTTIPAAAIAAHRADIDTFARMVDGDEVRFVPLSYARLLAAFAASPDADVRRHGEAVRIAFQPF